MTDKELVQALRGCSSQVWTIPNKAADRLEALMVKEAAMNELEQQLVNVEQDRLQIRLELDLLKANSWVEYCEDLHEYNCPRVKQIQKENAYLRESMKMQWISTRERLPEHGTECIVVVKYKFDFEKDFNFDVDSAEFVQEDGYIDNHWNTANDWYEGQQYMHVTHWMPLPEPPSTEGGWSE